MKAKMRVEYKVKVKNDKMRSSWQLIGGKSVCCKMQGWPLHLPFWWFRGKSCRAGIPLRYSMKAKITERNSEDYEEIVVKKSKKNFNFSKYEILIFSNLDLKNTSKPPKPSSLLYSLRIIWRSWIQMWEFHE